MAGPVVVSTGSQAERGGRRRTRIADGITLGPHQAGASLGLGGSLELSAVMAELEDAERRLDIDIKALQQRPR
jgi:hypothetical protein